MELSPQEQSVLRRFNESRKSPLSVLLRSSIYSIALAGLFLYLAIARNEALYAIGVFGMFVFYLAIRVYTAVRGGSPSAVGDVSTLTKHGLGATH